MTRSWTGSERVGSYFAYLGASVVGQLASLLLLPFITRRMPPAQFGVYALILAWGGLIAALGPSALRNVGFRLYFRWRDGGSGRTLFLALAGLQLVAFVLPFAVLGAIDPTSELTLELVVVGALAFVLADLYALQLFILRAESRAGLFGICEIAASAVRLTVTVALLESGHVSVTALLWAWIASSVVGLAIGFPFVNGVMTRGSDVRARARELGKDLVLPAARAVPLGVGSWANDVADRAILARLEGTGSVGIYSANYALSSRLVTAMSQPLFTLVWPRILKASAEEDGSKVEKEIAGGMRAYLWLAALPVAVLCVHPSWVTSVFLGQQYQGADAVVALVAVGAFFQGLVAYVTRGIEIAGRYGLMSMATLAAAVINVAGNFILIPQFGLAGAAAATTATYVGLVVFYVFLDPPRFVLKDPLPFLPPLLMALVATTVGDLVAGESVWLAAIVVVTIYGVAGAAVLWRLRAAREEVG